MKHVLKKSWLFVIILFIQLFILIYTFANYKQGFHSDEIYEYGFANSDDLVVLEKDSLGNGLDGRWTNSSEFLKYISVEKDNRFSYSNIYKHASMDYYNPPLKLFVLHTICSFFPGIFSKWFSFLINLISFIIMQVFLYLLMKRISDNDPLSVACVCLLGFNAGCFNSMTFLRMYAMGMALGIVFLYFSYSYFFDLERKKRIIDLCIIFISLFSGAYTLHLFLVFAFPLVLILCIGFLFFKKIKNVFCYGFTCLGAVGLSFLAFPKTVSDTMQSTDTYSYAAVKYSDFMQFRIYTYLATLDNFGFHTSPYSNPWIKNSIAIAIFIFIVSIPLFFLFRKEKWFVEFIKKIKNKFINYLRHINANFIFLIACLASSFFVIYISAIRTSVYIMSVKYTARYVYIIYPLLCIFVTLFTYYILNFFISNSKIVGFILIYAALFISSISQVLNSQPYLMLHEHKGVSLDKIESDANCYIMLMSEWFIVSFANELYETNSYYFTDYSDYKNETDCFDNIDHSKPLYMILDCSILLTDEVKKEMSENPDSLYNTVYSDIMVDETDVLNHYKSLSEVNNIEYVGEDCVFDRRIKIYRVRFNDI